MSFNCKICNKNYSSYKTLWRHNATHHKNENIVITNDTKVRSFECEHCNKKFTTKQSMNYHIKNTCNNIIKTKKIEEQIVELQNQINNIKSVKNITNNNTNNNSNNNKTINNIIVINKIGTENIADLNDNEIKEIFDKKFESIIKFVKHLNFNDRLPSNHNFCTTSLEGQYLQIYNTDESVNEKERKYYFFENLLCRSVSKMEQLYTKCKNSFTKDQQKQIDEDICTLKEIRDRDMNDKLLSEMLKKLNLLSYNYKETVLNTWKNGNITGKKLRTFEDDINNVDSDDDDIKEIDKIFDEKLKQIENNENKNSKKKKSKEIEI